MRKALQLDIAGHRLFGTLHDHDSVPSNQNVRTPQRVGILMLSFGQQPRSLVGDLGSSIADRLYARGYPAFRFDMPGFGDSPGDIPVYFEEVAREIQLGAHERPLFALCDELVKLYSLKGLVVCGFCGGSITALYAINSRSPKLLGLILLEPELALTRTDSQTATETSVPLTVDSFQERVDLLWQRLRSPGSWRQLLSGKADLGFWYELLDSAVRKLSIIGRRSKPLPHETNHRMLNAWQLARRLRIPTFVASVSTPNRIKYYHAYGLQPGVSDAKSALQWVEIPNTTHSMLTGGAKEAVGIYIENWVTETFPIETSRQK